MLRRLLRSYILLLVNFPLARMNTIVNVRRMMRMKTTAHPTRYGKSLSNMYLMVGSTRCCCNRNLFSSFFICSMRWSTNCRVISASISSFSLTDIFRGESARGLGNYSTRSEFFTRLPWTTTSYLLLHIYNQKTKACKIYSQTRIEGRHARAVFGLQPP